MDILKIFLAIIQAVENASGITSDVMGSPSKHEGDRQTEF